MRWYREYNTISLHIGKEYAHIIETGWEDTWRSAAVHWGEALPGAGWKVTGIHWMKQPDTGLPVCLGSTDATDCDIYDGWWDH